MVMGFMLGKKLANDIIAKWEAKKLDKVKDELFEELMKDPDFVREALARYRRGRSCRRRLRRRQCKCCRHS